MKKIKKFIKEKVFRHDLLIHFFAGFVIFVGLTIAFAILGVEEADFFAALITLLVVILKVVIWDDMLERGTFDFFDMVYGCAPPVIIKVFIDLL